MTDDASERIGDAEREAAVVALRVHRTAGRLDSTEYEDRSLAARGARTRADLGELFTDLPEPGPAPGPVPAEPAAAEHHVSASEAWSRTLIGLAPLLAVLLFFLTKSWLWFLAIPMIGVILGSGAHFGSDDDRRRPDR